MVNQNGLRLREYKDASLATTRMWSRQSEILR